MERHAGVQTHLGKLKAWCRGGGPAPCDLAALGREVWRSDLHDEANGLVVLGSPIGRKAFVVAHGRERIANEKVLLDQVQRMQDPQCAWVMPSRSAVPRANHMLRTVPPTLAAEYARAHDDEVWRCFRVLLGADKDDPDDLARSIATLPGGLGGLGLRSAERTAESAYWASWVDTLAVLHDKAPDLAAQAVRDLTREDGPQTDCMREAELGRAQLLGAGGQDIPTW